MELNLNEYGWGLISLEGKVTHITNQNVGRPYGRIAASLCGHTLVTIDDSPRLTPSASHV